MSSEADDLLLAELEHNCRAVCRLAESTDGLPTREVAGLLRTKFGLQSTVKPAIDWRALAAVLTRESGFWQRMVGLSGQLGADQQIEDLVGFNYQNEGGKARTLWTDLLIPTLERYGSRRPSWRWDELLARDLLSDWRESKERRVVWHRTVAPLHNLRGPDVPVEVSEDLTIRPFTDQDREELWRSFGIGATPTPYSPTIAQLEGWTHAIDHRWAMSRKPPLSDIEAMSEIERVVCSLRLLHPGVTGTTIIWTRLDPPDAPVSSGHLGSQLQAALDVRDFQHQLASQVGTRDGPRLAELIEAIRLEQDDARLGLALRRFDAAYRRLEPVDSLVDLWVAFEALLLPDIRNELRFRASVRIARLTGTDAKSRARAFEVAQSSYKTRSALVHGDAPPAHVADVVDQTRDLLRLSLKRWLLNRPVDGVKGLDRELLN